MLKILSLDILLNFYVSIGCITVVVCLFVFFLIFFFVCGFCVAPTFTIVEWIFRFPFKSCFAYLDLDRANRHEPFSAVVLWVSMLLAKSVFHPHPLWTESKYGYSLPVRFLLVYVLYYFMYRFRSNGFSARGGRHACIGYERSSMVS